VVIGTWYVPSKKTIFANFGHFEKAIASKYQAPTACSPAFLQLLGCFGFGRQPRIPYND
jgi:hypothetical protein